MDILNGSNLDELFKSSHHCEIVSRKKIRNAQTVFGSSYFNLCNYNLTIKGGFTSFFAKIS